MIEDIALGIFFGIVWVGALKLAIGVSFVALVAFASWLSFKKG